MPFQWDTRLKTKIPKLNLFDCPRAILRPLNNSNMAKLLIVKWAQNLVFVDISPVLVNPKLENTCKTAPFFYILRYARNGTSRQANLI